MFEGSLSPHQLSASAHTYTSRYTHTIVKPLTKEPLNKEHCSIKTHYNGSADLSRCPSLIPRFDKPPHPHPPPPNCWIPTLPAVRLRIGPALRATRWENISVVQRFTEALLCVTYASRVPLLAFSPRTWRRRLC